MSSNSPQDELFDRGKLLSSWLVTKYEDMKPHVSTAAKYTIGILIGLFILSFTLELVGIATEKNALIALGRITKAFLSLVILGLVSIIAITIKSISRGKISVVWYLRFMVHCFLYQLIIAFGIHVSAMPVTFSGLTTLTFASCIFALTLSLDNVWLKSIGTAILIFGVLGIFYPRGTIHMGKGCRQVNEPALIRLEHGDISSGKLNFFLKGEPAVWYLFIDSEGKYELFDAPGKHSLLKEDLLPITPEIVVKLMKNESLISPRNFGESYGTPKPPAKSGGNLEKTPDNKQPPAPEKPETDPKATEVTPKPVIDSRSQYAVVVIDENNARDWQLTNEIISWLGSEKAVSGNDHLKDFVMNGGDLSAVSRNQLARAAKKILLIAYKSNFDRAEDGYRLWTASYVAKVIDADNGRTIKIIPNSFPVKELDDAHAKKTAMELAKRSMENQCRNHL